jgi:hypothetical protein
MEQSRGDFLPKGRLQQSKKKVFFLVFLLTLLLWMLQWEGVIAGVVATILWLWGNRLVNKSQHTKDGRVKTVKDWVPSCPIWNFLLGFALGPWGKRMDLWCSLSRHKPHLDLEHFRLEGQLVLVPWTPWLGSEPLATAGFLPLVQSYGCASLFFPLSQEIEGKSWSRTWSPWFNLTQLLPLTLGKSLCSSNLSTTLCKGWRWG